MIAEDVNSPFNNVQLLQAVFGVAMTPVAEELRAISGLDFTALRGEFLRATDIVFTLGNVYHLESDGQPTLYDRDGAALVGESPAETAACLQAIFALLAQHTRATVWVSVSPVPIAGYRGDEFASAVEADCVSKSQLRAALHAVLKQFPALRYVPTFEMFRWLAPHEAFASYGGDDGNARHINQALLNRVIDLIAGTPAP